MKRPVKQWTRLPDGSLWRTTEALRYLRESLNKARAWAATKRVRSFVDSIKIEHNDGSCATFTRARMYRRPGPCFVVLTERYGSFVFLKEDANVRKGKGHEKHDNS
jgi:hypothetical protein